MKAREKQGIGKGDAAWHSPGGGDLRNREKPPVRLGLGLGAAALLGLLLVGRHAALRRPARPSAPAVRSPFEVSFAEAQGWYFRAQVIAKEQLEALEEWDSGALRGSAPEIYRRALMARTRETGLAETAAREALRRARTDEDSYRAARLLVHIEHELGHHAAEWEMARKLVALRPQRPEAALLLSRAAAETPGHSVFLRRKSVRHFDAKARNERKRETDRGDRLDRQTGGIARPKVRSLSRFRSFRAFASKN